MKNWGAFFDLINPDNTMSFNRLFAHSIGTVETIIYFSLISKCKYWDSRGMLIDDEWFYSTVDDLQESTAIARRQQENAISKLVDIGLIKCERKGIPAKRCFNIIYDPELLCSVIEEGKANIEKLRAKSTDKKSKTSVNSLFTSSAANDVESSSHQTYQQESTERTNKEVPNVPTINNLNKNNLNKNNLLSYQYNISEIKKICPVSKILQPLFTTDNRCVIMIIYDNHSPFLGLRGVRIWRTPKNSTSIFLKR